MGDAAPFLTWCLKKKNKPAENEAGSLDTIVCKGSEEGRRKVHVIKKGISRRRLLEMLCAQINVTAGRIGGKGVKPFIALTSLTEGVGKMKLFVLLSGKKKPAPKRTSSGVDNGLPARSIMGCSNEASKRTKRVKILLLRMETICMGGGKTLPQRFGLGM